MSIRIACLAFPLALLIASGGQESLIPAPAGPDHYKVGAYVTAIYDLNVAAGTFGADLWIWSVSTSPTRDPLQTMEFVNANQIHERLENIIERDGLYWRQHKITGRFRHDWVLRDYPFDRQVLKIVLEEGTYDAASVVYDPDMRNTGYQATDNVEGWRVTGISVESGVAHYATTFGDPASTGQSSDYTRATVSLRLVRTNLADFFTMSAPIYAAFLLSAVSFLLHSDDRGIINARLALLAAALFAAVLNFRATSLALGSAHVMTLLDKLNVLTLADVVFAILVAVVFNLLRARGHTTPLARRLDYVCCALVVSSFAVVNAALFAAAASG